jgi:flagellar hook assembly protein FlgD
MKYGKALEINGHCPVCVTVHDVLGREVAVIADGLHAAGLHTDGWNGRNGAGEGVRPGVYFLRFEAGDFKTNLKMVVLK